MTNCSGNMLRNLNWKHEGDLKSDGHNGNTKEKETAKALTPSNNERTAPQRNRSTYDEMMISWLALISFFSDLSRRTSLPDCQWWWCGEDLQQRMRELPYPTLREGLHLPLKTWGAREIKVSQARPALCWTHHDTCCKKKAHHTIYTLYIYLFYLNQMFGHRPLFPMPDDTHLWKLWEMCFQTEAVVRSYNIPPQPDQEHPKRSLQHL